LRRFMSRQQQISVISVAITTKSPSGAAIQTVPNRL